MDVQNRPFRSRTRTGLLRCGVVAGPLFSSVFLVEGAVRSDYHPLRHPISSLSLGPTGWTQRANFLLTGGLYVAGAVGLWRSRTQPGLDTRAGPILLGTVGIGLIGAGVFRCDPINGYPPGTADKSARTPAGHLHDGFSLPVFLCLPAAAVIYAHAASRPVTPPGSSVRSQPRSPSSPPSWRPAQVSAKSSLRWCRQRGRFNAPP